MNNYKDSLPTDNVGKGAVYCLRDADCSWLSKIDFLSLVIMLRGAPNLFLSTQNEIRFGSKGSLAIIPKKGIFADFENSKSGGILDFIINEGKATNRYEAAIWLKGNDVRLSNIQIPINNKIDKPSKMQGMARELWDKASEISETIAEKYLIECRLIPVRQMNVQNLRFLNNAPVLGNNVRRKYLPAMLAKAENIEGEFCGLQLTYLDKFGNKAIIPKPKIQIGKFKNGACIRLGNCDNLIIAEGIETALSAAFLTGRSAVATLGISGMLNFQPWRKFNSIIIAQDNDKSQSGESAALHLAHKLMNYGCNVSGILVPPKPFGDWNDFLKSGGGYEHP